MQLTSWLLSGRNLCRGDRQRDKQELIQYRGSPSSAYTQALSFPPSFPPSLSHFLSHSPTYSVSFHLSLPLSLSHTQSLCSDGWGYTAKEDLGARRVCFFSSLVCFLSLPPGFRHELLIPAPVSRMRRIYLWGRHNKGKGNKEQQGGEFCKPGVSE